MDSSTPLAPTGIAVPARRRTGTKRSSATAAAPVWVHESWWTVARVAVARSVLAVLLTLLVWAVLPLALGWTPHVIVSGSMQPRISTGDVVVTRPVDAGTIARGAVVTTVDPDRPDRTRTHRLVEHDAAGRLVTKGDANRDQDSTPVAGDDVLGQAVLLVPLVGKPAYWLATREHLALGALTVGLGALVLAAWSPPRRRSGPPAAGGRARGVHLGVRRRRVAARRVGAGVAAMEVVVLVVALAAAAPATHAAFSSRTLNPVSSLAAGAVFHPYRDAVLADAPSLYWRLEEKSGGTLADTSGNGRGGTASGAVLGKAGALPSETVSTAAGLDDAVLASWGTAPVGSAYSVEAWVRTTSTTGGPVLALTSALGTGAIDRALYLGSDGSVRFANSLGTGVVGPRVNDGQWHHLVFTSEIVSLLDTRGTLYVDGLRVAQGAAVGTGTSGYWASGRASFTGLLWSGTPSATYRGDVDELAVYATALSATRVQQHYAASGR